MSASRDAPSTASRARILPGHSGPGTGTEQARSETVTAVAPKPITSRPYPARRIGQGIHVPEDDPDHGSQGHRDPLPGRLVRLLHGRRRDGAADARRAGGAGAAVPVQRAVQPAVHHARHDHAAALRDADPVRVRELHRAAADRRARRGVPAAERVLVLAVPVRRADRDVRLPHPGRGRRLRLVRLHPAVRRDALAGRRRRPVDHGPGAGRSGHDPGRRSTSSPRSSACAPPA